MVPVACCLACFSLAAHKILCDKKSTLHKDISTNNIMLYHETTEPHSEPGTKLCCGLLIDFYYAALIGGDHALSDTHHTVHHFSIYIWP
jgi:hypothetical protein